jgi:hypothetical protein
LLKSIATVFLILQEKDTASREASKRRWIAASNLAYKNYHVSRGGRIPK